MRSINKYVTVGLIAFAVLVLAVFAGSEQTQDNDNDKSMNNTDNNTCCPTGQTNDTNKAHTEPISISLEKPPFIDE